MLEFPEHFAVGGAVRAKDAIRAPLEDEVTRSGQRAAAQRMRLFDPPGLALGDWIPGREVSARRHWFAGGRPRVGEVSSDVEGPSVVFPRFVDDVQP